MIGRLIATGALAALLIAAPVSAQGPWRLDVHAGPALPTADIGEEELSTGFGLGGALGYRFMEHLSAYVGWSWYKFGADEGEFGRRPGRRFWARSGVGSGRGNHVRPERGLEDLSGAPLPFDVP